MVNLTELMNSWRTVLSGCERLLIKRQSSLVGRDFRRAGRFIAKSSAKGRKEKTKNLFMRLCKTDSFKNLVVPFGHNPRSRSVHSGMRFRGTTYCWVILLILLDFVGSSFASSYSVKGHFTYQLYTFNKQGAEIAEKPLERVFDLSVEDCSWKMKIVLVGNTNYDYFSYVYDGTNLYYSSKFLPNTADRLLKSKNSEQHTSFTNLLEAMAVESGAVPRTITSAAGEYVWLAFASGCYFQGLTNNMATCLKSIRSRSGLMQRYQVPCHFSLSPLPPYLPMHVQYLKTNIESLGDDGKLVSHDLQPPFQGGYIRSEFTATAVTNFGMYQFPALFVYREYMPSPKTPTTTNLFCTLMVEGAILSLATNDSERSPNESISPSGRIVVHDSRIEGPAAMYVVSNTAIPEINSPIVAKAASNALRQFDRVTQLPTKSDSSKRVIAKCLLGVISVLPLGYYLYRWAGVRTGKTNKTKT